MPKFQKLSGPRGLITFSLLICPKPMFHKNHDYVLVIADESMTKQICTGCPKKNALLSLKAYNSGLEAAIGASRDSFGILWL